MIDFEKWHGNGNDFVIINTVEKNIKLTKSFIKKISDRNKGIGFDQLIAVGLPTKDDHDFFVRFYNSDSSEASMCLNGIRCASSYIWKNSLAPIKKISFKTKHNNIKCYPENNNDVSVVINKPKEIENPLLKKKLIKKLEINLSIFSMKDNSVRIRTFENGVGETLSCGSASLCVASYILSKNNKLKVKSIGGELKFKNHIDGILMSGPTNYIYKGNINE